MICRRDLRAALIALALAVTLGSCSAADDRQTVPALPPADPAFVELLEGANGAIANGALDDAGRQLDQAREIAPDHPDLWVAIARLRYRGGEHLTALDAANRALELGPRHAPALLMRALMVRDAHGFNAALPWFEAALAADPDNADIWAEYAATLGDAGRARAMLRAARKLAQIAPDDSRALYLQAVLAARGREYPLARSLLVRSNMVARGVPAAQLLDAVLSMEEGNPDSAAAMLEELARRQPANARVRDLLAKALFLSGRDDEVIARFALDAQQAEASPYLIALVARAHERLGDRRRATPLLARAYQTARPRPVVLAPRPGLAPPVADARRAALAGNWAAAQRQAAALRQRFPASADIASLLGDTLVGARDPHAALAAYAEATRVRRPWPLTRKAVLAYRGSGDPVAADTLLARHVAGEPGGLTGVVELAQALAVRGDWKRTAQLLDYAIRRGGGYDPVVISLRIKAAEGMNRSSDARYFAALLAEIRPQSLAQQ